MHLQARSEYRPHLRVVGRDELLGVQFVRDGSSTVLELGVELDAALGLMYEPDVDYSSLVPGTRIQVMEGPRVVAIGSVIK